MAKYDFILNCQECGKTLWFKYHILPDCKTVCPECYAEYERKLNKS